MDDITPISTAEFPVPEYEPDLLGGHDVNIILMVQEHAPRRVKEIETQIRDLSERIHKLNAEKDTLNKLIAAITE